MRNENDGAIMPYVPCVSTYCGMLIGMQWNDIYNYD
jgi:hypothetical protein